MDRHDAVVVPGGGYSVRFAADSRRRPVLLDDGALAVFPFGPENAAGASDGTIQVSVGTPARAAAIMGANGPGEVFGASLEDLRLQYLREQSDHVITRSAQEIAGQTAIVVRVDDGGGGMRAVALIAHGGRNFVITASGFQILYGAISDFPAELGLDRFITGFRFGTSLFVSRELGFQVPLPVDARPFGTAVKLPPGEANGLYVFGDGVAVGDRWSDSIAVSVGTMLNPALVRVLPSLNPKPTPYRIGATSLIGLQSAYLAAIALAVHRWVPNQQTADPTRLYPRFLWAVIVAGILLGLTQRLWRPRRQSPCQSHPRHRRPPSPNRNQLRSRPQRQNQRKRRRPKTPTISHGYMASTQTPSPRCKPPASTPIVSSRRPASIT